MIEFDTDLLAERPIASIKVVGVGGGGGNTVNSMIAANLADIEFIVVNTDAQALHLSHAHHKIQLGAKSTKGLGTGADPEVGKKAAEEDLSKVMDYLEDADIVFLTAGMGGGTGSGGLPVIARALKEKNILTIAVLTKPFSFEGKKRARVAEDAIAQVRPDIDTLLVIPNQKLLDTVDHTVSMVDAFSMINALLTQSVKGIADIISKPGHINVDFADVKTIMKGMGLAVMGTGRAAGKDRAHQAAIQAISSPLLETMNIHGARGVLINISGGSSLGLHEIGLAANLVTEHADPQANIIVGSVIDPSLGDDVLITVIATGFDPAPSVQSSKELHLSPQTTPPTQHASVKGAARDRWESELAKNLVPDPNSGTVRADNPPSLPSSKPHISQASGEREPSVAQSLAEEYNHHRAAIQDLDVPTFLRKYTTEQEQQ